ncbi:MAG: hypothetical protein RSC66_14835 [Comamonas sp.]
MKGFCVLIAAAALAGCTVVPAGTARQACDLIQVASDEADLAPGWYVDAGAVLASCGREGAIAAGDRRACYASARNGYRDSKECEAMP